jgi:AcrR family transcriptional regulator
LTKHQNTDETQKNILGVAEGLFMEFGYKAVSTRQVAKLCGISQPTLYYHFADKQELYVAVLLEVLRRMSRDLYNISGEVGRMLEEKLNGLAICIMQQTGRDLNVRAMLQDIASQLDEAAQLKVSEAFFRSMILPIMNTLQEAYPGQAKPSGGMSVVSLAFLFLNMISTINDRRIQLDWRKMEPPETIEERAARLTGFFLHGLQNS